MKHLVLLLIAISIFSITEISAQCTAVPFSGPSLTNPDTTQGIAIAAETQAYSQVIQVRIPADTNFNGAVIPIDSAGILSVTGAPSSISWITNSPNNYWPGDTFGCVLVQGTPAIGEAGDYNIVIVVSVNALGTAMPYTLNYSFKILDASFAGIDLKKSQAFQVFQNQPNPFSNSSTINYFVPKSGDVEFNVFDILGNKVLSQNKVSTTGKNSIKINKENLAEGVYIYELIYQNKAIRKRMIIE
jgi:hypothetical protein